jgi:hypothetical protein
MSTENEAEFRPFPPPDLPSADAGFRPAKAEPSARAPLKPRSNRRHGLTIRQNDFCAHYVATGNAGAAARAAGYSERAAYNQGYRLLKDARVQARIRAVQTEIADGVEPGMVLGRLDELYERAERKGDYRAAARILESMSRLVGLDTRGAAAYLRAPRAGKENDDK